MDVLAKRWSGAPLLVKVLLLSLSLLMAAVVATGASTFFISRASLRDEIVATGKSMVRAFASNNQLELLDDQTGRQNLQLRLQGVSDTDVEKRLIGAYVRDRQGDLVAEVGRIDPDALNKAKFPTTSNEVSVLMDETSITLIAAMMFEGLILGHIVYCYDVSAIRDAGNRILWGTVQIIALAVVINVVLLLFLLRGLLRPVVALGHAAEQLANGDYSHHVTGTLSDDEIGTAAKSFNRMCDALSVHMRFSNRALARLIRTGSVPEQGREHNLSIIFGDAKGYTHWSQSRTPDDVFRTLNRMFTLFGHITVDRFGGIVDKFIGDGVMAHFGLSDEAIPYGTMHPYTRDALRATIYGQFALRILRYAIEELEGGAPLWYRFGIASGRCLVGAIGARNILLDYSLIGNVVNLASRLEGQAAPGGLAIDRFTLLDCGHDFVNVVDRGERQVKGIDRPVQTFAVAGFTDPDEEAAMRHFFTNDFWESDIVRWALLAGDEDASGDKRAKLHEHVAKLLAKGGDGLLLPIG